MDDLLPSYESAIEQNPWELVARYLPSDDLCSAALVCQKWHEIFTPTLWGNPASHFGVENDTLYVALTRFKRTLFWARLYVRELTHTLHLPPAHAELYGGPHCEWLRDCFERLPNLQSLIVNGLPIFDHSALLTLRHSSQWWRMTHPESYPVFGLRLLDASHCTNTTSTGLAEALPHFPDLVSLNFSGTLAAKDASVLSRLKYLPNLRVLNLRGLGLRDIDIEVVAASITMRVRSLDVSENNLTDTSARLLLEQCMRDVNYDTLRTHSPLPPVADGRPLGELDVFGTDDIDSHIRRKLTQGFVGRLAVEEAGDAGITRLYLSKNMMTVEGVSALVRSRRLHVLDVGTLPVTFQRSQYFSSGDKLGEARLPGVEKLTPALAECASENMVYLRVSYSVVTEDAHPDMLPSPRVELDASSVEEMHTSATELEALEQSRAELESNDAEVYELPGDEVHPTELPESSPSTEDTVYSGGSSPSSQLSRAPTISVTREPSEVKRGAAYAPEPVVSEGLPHTGPAYAPEPAISETLLSPLSTFGGTFTDATGGLSPVSETFDTRSLASDHTTDFVEKPHRNSTSSTRFVEDRRARLDSRQSMECRLHPGMLPKMHTLVLTDVPTTTENREDVDRFIQFIRDCAEEAAIAKLRARHTYALPPGRSRAVAEREYSRTLFALRRIVLEMAPPQTAPKKISTSWRRHPKSSTLDSDTEAFWEAATHDFSFFGDEECGLPNVSQAPLAAMNGLMLAPKKPAPPPQSLQPEERVKPTIDIVSEIAKFRKERKGAYQVAMQLGETDPIVEGYWPGDITVVRRPASQETGSLDYYGNRFEGGWLYR